MDDPGGGEGHGNDMVDGTNWREGNGRKDKKGDIEAYMRISFRGQEEDGDCQGVADSIVERWRSIMMRF